VFQNKRLHLWSEHKLAVNFVTHSLDEAITLADRVVVLSPRSWRVCAIIPVEIERPRQVSTLRARPGYGRHYQDRWNLIKPDMKETEMSLAPDSMPRIVSSAPVSGSARVLWHGDKK